jgi:hypothetical protein
MFCLEDGLAGNRKGLYNFLKFWQGREDKNTENSVQINISINHPATDYCGIYRPCREAAEHSDGMLAVLSYLLLSSSLAPVSS